MLPDMALARTLRSGQDEPPSYAGTFRFNPRPSESSEPKKREWMGIEPTKRRYDVPPVLKTGTVTRAAFTPESRTKRMRALAR